MEIIQDKINPHMYRVQYDDGTISDEMWNKTWAREHIRRIEAGETDIVDVLKDAGYGVVEGKEAVLDRIEKMGPSTENKIPRIATEMAAGALKKKKGIHLPETQ